MGDFVANSDLFSSLRFLRKRGDGRRCRKEALADNWAEIRCGQREWEDLTAGAGSTSKKVRSTHGVNCTGSCSWDVYVKDGIIISELQNVNYPSCGAGFPDHEPRGCPRGATYSWYTYSPLRLKYPYIRSNLLEMWREALKSQPSKGVWSPGPEEPRQDPVAAWQSIVEDPSKRRAYQQARGKGGLVRVSHEEAATLIAAALVYTIKKYGPDRVFGFTPIPAMSMVGYSSGARFVSLIGGSMLSFLRLVLRPSSGVTSDVGRADQRAGECGLVRVHVPVSVWGTNVPMTRTPDAHFYSEARYRGAKVAAVSPDYAEYVKFADTWLPARQGRIRLWPWP